MGSDYPVNFISFHLYEESSLLPVSRHLYNLSQHSQILHMQHCDAETIIVIDIFMNRSYDTDFTQLQFAVNNLDFQNKTSCLRSD